MKKSLAPPKDSPKTKPWAGGTPPTHVVIDRDILLQYATHLLREWAAHSPQTRESMAKALNLSKAAIVYIVKDTPAATFGGKIERAFVDRWGNGSFDTFHTRAAEWAAREGITSRITPWSDEVRAQPRLRVALEMGRAEGIPMDFLQSFASQCREEPDSGAELWWTRIKVAHDAYVRALLAELEEHETDDVKGAKARTRRKPRE